MSHYGDIYADDCYEREQAARERRKYKEEKINALLSLDTDDKVSIILKCMLEKMSTGELEKLCEEYL
ncbi:MAG: hypothetical protein IKL53_02390 [Lachnospiraceae bacterium]|nr:hypothetical protein [Lachnospiraceae bacterium]